MKGPPVRDLLPYVASSPRAPVGARRRARGESPKAAIKSSPALSAAKLDTLQREAPQTAAAFHQFVAALLAERLKHANDTLRVLLD